MKTKDTNDLQKELTSAPDLSRFLSENKEHFINENFSTINLKLDLRTSPTGF